MIRESAGAEGHLGPPDTWPLALQLSVGLILQSKFPMFIAWGPDLAMIYNEAYAELLGKKHPRALGARFADVWQEIWPDIAPLIDEALSGQSLYREDLPLLTNRHGYNEQCWFTFSYSPLRDETGAIGGMFCAVAETTQQVHARRRQGFRLSLEERLRDLADPRAIMAEAAEMLGTSLEMDRVTYAEISERDDSIHVMAEWTRSGTSQGSRSYRPSELGRNVLKHLGQGRIVAIQDIQSEPGLSSLAAATLSAMGTRSLLSVPLLKEGQCRALLVLQRNRPQPWTNDEKTLAGDVAERTWAAVERARAEAERREGEERLREREEQLRLATEAGEIELWDLDILSGELYWPPAVKAMFGLSPEVSVSMTDFYAGLHPDDRNRITEAVQVALDPAVRAPYDVEFRTVGRKDSLVRWIAAKGRAIFDESGRCVRLIGTAVDITQQKADEATLRELNQTLERRIAEALSERRLLAEIVEGTDLFVEVLDRDYRWLAINRAASDEFARIFGVRRPGVGDSLPDLLADRPGHLAGVRSVWARALAGEDFVEIGRFGDTGYDVRDYEMLFRCLRNADGQPVGAYLFGHDVTDRLRDQARLREAEGALMQIQKMEAVGRLTGGIAHDFNNVLGAIVGGLDLIRRKPDDVERVRRFARAGLDAAERGAKLTGQLLAFSRSQRIEMKPVVVADIVAGMRELLERTLGPMVQLGFDLDTERVPVLTDPTQLEMAVLNLAINARDAMEQGGDLQITTVIRQIRQDTDLEPGEYVELSVTDTGTGMPPDVLAKAFEPFFTTKGVGAGTGLGLSQVYGIARQAGGSARIESRLGSGTTVRVFLPRTSVGPAPDAPHDPARLTLGTTATDTILPVDDDADIRNMLSASLETLGYRVIEAEDGPSALARLIDRKPDLMMVDFAMPGMNGAEVARAALALRPGLPIVFASGYADTAAIEDVAGPQATILRKPFRIDDMQAVVTAALEARA